MIKGFDQLFFYHILIKKIEAALLIQPLILLFLLMKTDNQIIFYHKTGNF
jgi:hypothetical protein